MYVSVGFSPFDLKLCLSDRYNRILLVFVVNYFHFPEAAHIHLNIVIEPWLSLKTACEVHGGRT